MFAYVNQRTKIDASDQHRIGYMCTPYVLEHIFTLIFILLLIRILLLEYIISIKYESIKLEDIIARWRITHIKTYSSPQWKKQLN